jgi:hypothetical protein
MGGGDRLHDEDRERRLSKSHGKDNADGEFDEDGTIHELLLS